MYFAYDLSVESSMEQFYGGFVLWFIEIEFSTIIPLILSNESDLYTVI